MRNDLHHQGGWNRHGGYIFMLCVFILFVHLGLYTGTKYRSKPDTESPAKVGFSSILPSITHHPIPQLIEDAEAQFRAKLERQSTTLKAATAEYKRRYKRSPPKGFDQWWEFAQKNNHVMVDEYDGLSEDLEPFWALSGEEVRRRSMQVGALPSIDLVRIRDGKVSVVNVEKGFEDLEVSARAQGFARMTEKFAHLLPDMDLPINAKAEGRVVVPWEARQYANLSHSDSSQGIESVIGGPFYPDWRGEGNVWEAVRRTCDPSSPARRLFSSVRSIFSAYPKPGSDFAFLSRTSSNLDLCAKPHAHYQQGHLFSDWRTIPALYPVFSPAKAKGFMDIRIPSHYYYGSTKLYTYGWDPVNMELRDVDDMEVRWEEKQEKVFWRGSTTGGGNNPPGFAPQYHRHRFVRMASLTDTEENRTVTFLDPSGSQYISATVSVGELNEDVIDAAFVKATNPNAYPGGMEALAREHRFGDAVPLGRHWAYKYLMDLDGMGYSGRFMAFMASDSVPVKSTVYDEYFSDWIQPWVHFIPLSTTYKEIYNIFSYFSGPPPSVIKAAGLENETLSTSDFASQDGDNRLRRIARAGKQWKKHMGRKEDMQIYVYRLCLEYARLVADDRDAMSLRM
ncbi:hypothetical protein BDZ89DRAFT_1059561 [Hymenopellis radicata]|nr:hypothetical protein BDZ89DRAFT_1059561 [Hymenopellis radicata]